MATTKDDTPKIRSVYNPKGKELEMLQRVYERLYRMRDNKKRQEAEKTWKKSRIAWEALRLERDPDEWQSNHCVPLTTAVVETALSEIIDQSPKPMILPRGSEDAPKAAVMEHIFEYTWDVSDSDLELEEILHDAFIFGTGIGQEYYYRDIRKIQTAGANGSLTEHDATDYEDCILESVPLEDFYIDETARGFRGAYGARDCIRRYLMHIDDFKIFFAGSIWDPLGNAKYVQPGGDTAYYQYYQPNQNSDIFTKDQVEILWYWSVKPDDWLVIVANDVVVVMGPNPYKHKQLPFARATDIKRTHEFYGKGEAELLESIQDELNTLRRMIIDRNHLDIDKMFLGSNRLNLSDEDIIARPHGFIPVEDPNLIRAVEYADIPRSVELSLQHLEDDATISTGINPRAQALPTTGTATEAAILKESTLKRIRLKVRRLEREFLTRIARLRVANILQFYPQPRMEKIVGEAATKQFKDEIAQLEQQGVSETTNLKKIGKDVFQKKYKNIRLEGKAINFDASGNPKTENAQGTTFFELKPEYFMPNEGGFDIKYAAGSTLPISEPLMQSKASEMYDRLVQLAMAGIGYDPIKLGDLLLTVNHYNPSDFHAQNTQQQDDSSRVSMSIDLASTENGLIMQGKQVPPTPYAPVPHTQVHIQFTGSPQFQQLSKEDTRVQIMLDHITGELAAQQERSGAPAQGAPGATQEAAGSTGPGGPPPTGLPPRNQQPPTAQAGGNAQMNNLMPGKIQGGGQVPPGI